MARRPRAQESMKLLTIVVVIGIQFVAAKSLGREAGSTDPLGRHMQAMLTTDDEWRTPNPDYEQGKRRPKEYAMHFHMQPDGKHVTGELMGVYDDGRRVSYWALLSMYNPVTEKVVTQQIGWDGTLLYGENDVQTGDTQTIDMIEYNANGKMDIVRHVSHFSGAEMHNSDVYERKDGEWVPKAKWTWHRVEGADHGSESGEHEPGGIEKHAARLVAGSGRWRSPNPDFTAGSNDPEFFGMNYRWGLRKQYVIGEIVSIDERGSEKKEWSLYLINNPVTGLAHLYQTGTNGVFFRGEFGISADGMHSQTGLIYLPNGAVKSVHDDVEFVDDDTYISHVHERDKSGDWKKVRQWTWQRVAKAPSD